MNTSNWNLPQVEEQSMEAGDWRSQLQPDSRQKIINKMMDTLKKHLPFSGQEGLQELMKITARFEEKIYTAASSQSDYLQKISLKMPTIGAKSQITVGSSLQSSSTGNSKSLPDPVGSFSVQPQVPNLGLALSMQLSANQSLAWQQPLSQNRQSDIPAAGVQSSSGLSSALTPASGLMQTPIPNLMGTNNERRPQGGLPMDTGEWRSQLQPISRQRIINKILDTLKRRLPLTDEEGIYELKKIAERFEERIYGSASSQSDYLRKISLKMLSFEGQSHCTTPPSNLKRRRVFA